MLNTFFLSDSFWCDKDVTIWFSELKIPKNAFFLKHFCKWFFVDPYFSFLDGIDKPFMKQAHPTSGCAAAYH